VTDWPSYRQAVEALPYGKRLPGAVYIHREAPACQSGPLGSLLQALALRHAVDNQFNVVKLRTDAPRISFLAYPDFFDIAHPVLAAALAVDFAAGRVVATDYRDSLNPPILHRKELLLPPDHREAQVFAALSSTEEAAGLFEDTSFIGFRLNWERLLAEKALAIDGHSLAKSDGQPLPPLRADRGLTGVQRHRTALTRYSLSKPVKTLLEFGLLAVGESLFDYGCGLGADVRGLRELGFTAQGWDPVHAPEGERQEADVVNLGYVLNVIEDPAERLATLLDAWHLTRKVLAVSVLVRGASDLVQADAFQDGVLTTRGTFQKHFEQQELAQYLEDALERLPVPVSMGLFYVFRDPLQHQAFLTARSRRSIDWASVQLERPTRLPREPRERTPRVDKYETHRELVDAFWLHCLRLGRLPVGREFGRSEELDSAFGSPKRALAGLLRRGRADLFDAARAARINDLLVYLALAHLQPKVPFSLLPEAIRTDIREFFGTYSRALESGLTLLHAAADAQTVSLACENSAVGWQDSSALYVHTAGIGQLPPLLRAYVGCAERLYGDARQADLVKLHKASGKVSFMTYNSFDTVLLPDLVTRIKVNLRTLAVEPFDHTGDGELLFFKERFLADVNPQHSELHAFSEALRTLGIPDQAFFGPKLGHLAVMLQGHPLRDYVLGSLSSAARSQVR